MYFSQAHYDDDCLDVGHLGFSRLKIAFKNLKASWQFFSSDLLSKFWKQIAGKNLKANRWKIFESFLEANRRQIFWKQIAGNILKASWRFFLQRIFCQRLDFKFLKAFLLAKFWKLWNRWRKLDNENLLSKFWKIEDFKTLKAPSVQNFAISRIFKILKAIAVEILNV